MKHPDGTVIVEHNDGTRITTYYVDVSKGMDNETGEEEIRRHEPIKYVKVFISYYLVDLQGCTTVMSQARQTFQLKEELKNMLGISGG